jgi:ubiquinone/menaquinone biosynthesis C-methylase UbiE
MKRIVRKDINTKEYWNNVYEKGIDPEVIKMDEFKFRNIAHYIVAGKVLDLGCGTGELCKTILEERPHCDVYGVDFSGVAIEKARKLNEGHFFEVADVAATGFSDKEFDYVISSEMLEHLEEPKELIKEAARVLKPYGVFILTTPFEDHIPSIEHLWEFNYSDIENMLFKWFSNFWVFPWAAGWSEVRETKNQALVYPKGHWDTIMALAII